MEMRPCLGALDVAVEAEELGGQQDEGQMIVDMDGFARAECGVENLDTPDRHDFDRTTVGPGTAGPPA